MVQVLFYTRPDCAPCRDVKRWLSTKNIVFKEFNLDETMAEFRTSPTMVIGEHVIVGPNFGMIVNALRSVGIPV